jgi:hypothetical protein
VQRVRRQRGARPGLHDLPGVHHQHPVGDLQHGAEVVADEQHREPVLALQPAQQVDDRPLHHHVEPGRRLVQHDEPGPEQQRERQHDPLPHPAGQLVRVGPQHALGVELHVAQHLEHPLARVALGAWVPAVRLHGVPELPLDAEHRVEGVHGRLEHRGDLPPAQPVQLAVGQGVQVPAVEPDLPAGVVRGPVEQPEQGVAQGGLPAAGLTEQADELALGEVEGHVPDGVRGRQVPGPVVDGQVADLDERHHGSLRCGLLSASTPKFTKVSAVVRRASSRPGTTRRANAPVSRAPSVFAQ